MKNTMMSAALSFFLAPAAPAHPESDCPPAIRASLMTRAWHIQDAFEGYRHAKELGMSDIEARLRFPAANFYPEYWNIPPGGDLHPSGYKKSVVEDIRIERWDWYSRMRDGKCEE